MTLLLEVGGVRWARLLGRVNRFTVEVADGGGGSRRLCHLHDPGRLVHLLRPGARVLVRDAWRPGRRTSCDVVAVEHGGLLVLEDTRLPNKLFPRAAATLLPWLRVGASEVQVNGFRVDFAGSTVDGRPVLVEVKGTNLVEDGVALFPDAPSRRAVRQLEALASASSAGALGVVVFTVLRPDARLVAPNRAVDPVFASRLCALRGRLRYVAYTVEARLEDGGSVLRVYMGGRVPVEACG